MPIMNNEYKEGHIFNAYNQEYTQVWNNEFSQVIK